MGKWEELKKKKKASSCVRGNSGYVPETYSKKQHMELTSS